MCDPSLRIQEILATPEHICIHPSQPISGETCIVHVQIPTVCGNSKADFTPGRILASFSVVCEENCLAIPRVCSDWDAITCRFLVEKDGERLPGVCYVTQVAPEVSVSHEQPSHRPLKSIGLSSRIADFQTVVDDAAALNIRQCIGGFSQPASMAMPDTPDTTPFVSNGKTYHFKNAVIRKLDSYMQPMAKLGIHALLRHHNDPFYYGQMADEGIVDTIIHPDYDYDCPSTFISAFNLRTEEGVGHFIACLEFFLSRYAAGDPEHGLSFGMEIGNEVNSAYIWNNAGEMDVNGAMLEYTSVMRIAWLVARKYNEHFRIYGSFDQYFDGVHIPDQPLRFYSMKDCFKAIMAHCRAEGDFPWNVAIHPYPENLRYPDFWNDRSPDWRFDTERITFKNIEVLPAWLAREEMLYQGEPRHVALTEEGLNTRPEQPYTGTQSKYAYVLAYLKLRKLDTVDIFQYYPYMDNPWEFGLNLGLRHFGHYTETQGQVPGDPKPVYYAIQAMDSPAEEAIVEEARQYIGPDIFDYTLNPPTVAEALPVSGDLDLPASGINNQRARDALARRQK